MRTSDDSADSADPRSMRQILATRPVGPLVLGKSLSAIGVFATNVAGAILVFSITGSARWVSAVTIAQFLPQIFLAPASGSRADRTDRVQQTLLGASFLMLGLSILLLWGHLRGYTSERDATVVVIAAGVVGIGFAYGGPALQSLFPILVRPSELKSVIALGSLPATFGRTLGPALGAVLATQIGWLATFWFSLLLQFAFVACVSFAFWSIPRPEPANTRKKDVRLREFLVYMQTEPRLRTLLIGVACVGIAVDPLITLMPAYVDHLSAEPALVGGITSAFGAGSVLGVMMMSRVGPIFPARHLGPLGLTGLSLSLVGLVGASTVSAAVASASIAGMSMTIGISSYTTLMQFVTPNHLRGRLTAVWSMAFLGSRPFAAGISGIITDYFGVRAAIAAVALVASLGVVIARPSRLVRRNGLA